MLHNLPLCSPRKTNLNFLKGLLKSADADMLNDAELNSYSILS